MAGPPSWKGHLRVSLVTVPVKAYTATARGGGRIQLNQLHEECHSRIQHKKTCVIHGEVPSHEIVSGYEYSRGQYVIVDPAELDKLRTPNERALSIQEFIPPDSLDPICFTDRTYYLLPEGPVGQKPFAVLQQAMVEEKRYGIGQIVLHGREHLVVLRPIQNLLAMTVLLYDAQITTPEAFEEDVIPVEASEEEMQLAKTLIDTCTVRKLDYARYEDKYTEKLTQLIEAKVAGQEIVAPPVQEHAQIINLMDALKESVAKARGEEGAKPPKKMAPSKPTKAEPKRRRKSS
jgi:DNA end-binding protein Ku